jgi:hypothetical protein
MLVLFGASITTNPHVEYKSWGIPPPTAQLFSNPLGYAFKTSFDLFYG